MFMNNFLSTSTCLILVTIRKFFNETNKNVKMKGKMVK